MPQKGKGKSGANNNDGSDDGEMDAIEAITNAIIQEVKASQEAQMEPIANGRTEIPIDDDNEPKLLRIIIYESSVWQYVQRF